MSSSSRLQNEHFFVLGLPFRKLYFSLWGYRFYLREIEEVFYRWPAVEECAVVGLPDPEYGEKVTACIVPKDKNKRPDPVELKAFLKKHLASCKIPKVYIFLEELPKGNTGKPLKRELKKQVA
jgi:long-chain acyl-CoA synthetase